MLPIVQEYLNYYKNNENASKHTLIAYTRILSSFVDYFKFTNENNIKEISLKDLRKFQGNHGNSSASTVAQITACVKSFFKYMTEVEFINNNVALGLKSPKIPKRLPKYLTQKESNQLLNQVSKTNTRQPERDTAILMIFLSTGIRLSELCNINVSDINDGVLTVIGKNNKQRQIPLNKQCQESINEYLSNKKYFCGDALFTTERNNRIKANPVGVIVKNYLKQIGKGDMSVHKLRHTAASTWLNNGADLLQIKELLGHSNINTTTIYTHIDNGSLKDVVNSVKFEREG